MDSELIKRKMIAVYIQVNFKASELGLPRFSSVWKSPALLDEVIDKAAAEVEAKGRATRNGAGAVFRYQQVTGGVVPFERRFNSLPETEEDVVHRTVKKLLEDPNLFDGKSVMDVIKTLPIRQRRAQLRPFKELFRLQVKATQDALLRSKGETPWAPPFKRVIAITALMHELFGAEGEGIASWERPQKPSLQHLYDHLSLVLDAKLNELSGNILKVKALQAGLRGAEVTAFDIDRIRRAAIWAELVEDPPSKEFIAAHRAYIELKLKVLKMDPDKQDELTEKMVNTRFHLTNLHLKAVSGDQESLARVVRLAECLDIEVPDNDNLEAFLDNPGFEPAYEKLVAEHNARADWLFQDSGRVSNPDPAPAI